MRALYLVLTAGLFLGALGGTATAELRIFVTNEKSDDVTVIDAASGKVVTHIAVGKRPRGITVSPDGKRVYVASSNSDSVSPRPASIPRASP